MKMVEGKIKMVKTPLVLPQDVLESIDRLMGKRKRSRFVTEAARKELKRLQLQRALDRAAGVWQDGQHPELEKKGTHRWVRDLRKEADKRFSDIIE